MDQEQIKENIKNVLRVIAGAYPDFKRSISTDGEIDKQKLREAIETWTFFLSDYDVQTIMVALKTYVNESGSDFAPTPSKIIEYIHRPSELSVMGEAEAWNLVRKCIGRGTRSCAEDFASLPPLVQKAVGGADQIYTWATDERFNEGVVMSNFISNYKTVVNRQNQVDRLPLEEKQKLEQLQQDTFLKIEQNLNNGSASAAVD